MINIGSEAVHAVQELHGNRDFDELITALGVVAQTKMFEAARVPPDQRVDATAYARGMYELWGALHAVHSGLHPAQVKPPKVPAKGLAYAQ